MDGDVKSNVVSLVEVRKKREEECKDDSVVYGYTADDYESDVEMRLCYTAEDQVFGIQMTSVMGHEMTSSMFFKAQFADIIKDFIIKNLVTDDG